MKVGINKYIDERIIKLVFERIETISKDTEEIIFDIYKCKNIDNEFIRWIYRRIYNVRKAFFTIIFLYTTKRIMGVENINDKKLLSKIEEVIRSDEYKRLKELNSINMGDVNV